MVKVVNKSGTDQIAFNLAVCMLSLMFATLLWQTWSKRKLYQELLEKISETIDKHDEKKPNFLTKENIIMHIYLFLCFIANFGMASGLILMSNKSVSMEGIYIMMGLTLQNFLLLFWTFHAHAQWGESLQKRRNGYKKS